MSTLSSGAGAAPATALHTSVRRATVVLIALLVAAVVVLSIALINSDGSSAGDPVQVAPTSGPIPPSPAERNQPPGLNGPGMRP